MLQTPIIMKVVAIAPLHTRTTHTRKINGMQLIRRKPCSARFVEKVAIGSNAVYTGQFESGKRHGKGMTRYADGSSFTGDYLNDLKHGWGEQVT